MNLEPWIARAAKSLVTSFANGIVRDCAAVRAGIYLLEAKLIGSI
jgi:hypothetical protein